MKKYYVAICILMLIGIIGCTVVLIMSPDTIPMHYNFRGEIDHWGSKYENLLFPCLILLLGAFLMLSAKKQWGKIGKTNEKTMLTAAAFVILFLDAVALYLSVRALLVSNGVDEGEIPGIGKFVGVAFGAFLCLLGNITPKVRRNTVFGLRARWICNNDRVWQKSQRFAGISSVICGLAIIILSVILSDMWILISLITVIAVWTSLTLAVSYRYYLDERKGENQNADT